MSILPWDTLFLAGFAYSGYRTLGRWVKYTEDTAKAQSDTGYIDGFCEFLAEAAAAGDRTKATPGAGADVSGQGHLWRDWNGMKIKQRLALLEEMHKVLEWTGQDSVYRAMKQYAGVPWSQLPHKAKKELLVAADQLDWSFVKQIEQEGSALGTNSRLWQLNEAIPALSVEPALAESVIEEAQDLQGLVASADTAVNELLTSQQAAVIAALSPAQELQVLEARRKVDLLREAAQGGLGLGSGGRAARGQQLLELLRSISLKPSDDAAAAAKSAAAAAALDDQADQAVSGLRDQHEKALAAAVAAARGQSVAAALAKHIRFSPGKAPLSSATAAAVIDLAADELAAAVDALDKAEGLAAKRTAAESLMSMSGIIDSTAAALAAAAPDDDDDEDEESDLSDLADKLVNQTTRLAELKLRGPSTPAATTGNGDSATPATTRDQDAAAAVRDALQAVRAAAAEGSSDAAADGSGAESLKESVMREVDETVSQVEERTKASQESALQNARSRERMSLLLSKVKQILSPPPAAAAARDESSAAESSSAESSPEKLAVTKDYLKQLGTQPLAAALTDLNRLVAAAGDEGASGLSWGLTLEPTSLNSLTRLGDLLTEIDLAESVMSLELGPNVNNTLQALRSYMERVQTRHREEEERRAAGLESDEAVESDFLLVQSSVPAGEDSASTPKDFGVSPNQIKEAEAIDKCTQLIDDLNQDGLVVLGLSGGQYRQLAQLKEAVGSLTAGMDALKYDRSVSALKDVASQLGPIGAAIQVKLADTTDESTRQLMSKQKTLAVELYQKLQSFLSFEDNVRGPLKSSLRELASLAGGIGAPQTTSGCETATLKLEMAEEEAQKLQEALSHLATSTDNSQQGGDASATPGPAADSVAAVQKIVESLEGSIEALQASVSNLTAHVNLRVRAMDSEVAAAAAAAGVEGADLDLNTLEDMTPELDHPLHILGDAPDDQQAAWEHTGFEQIARGRVAAVLIATAAADSAAAATAGAADGTPRVALAVGGLPSGKSVLQLIAERILRLQRLAATSSFGKNAPVSRQIQCYIMTSPATHDKLSSTLKNHSYFGLNSNQVRLFECKTAPPAFAGEPLKALTLGSATLSRGSPGSGEVFAALKRSGALGHMKRSGVRHVEINAVDDNILARSADPMFIGFCVDSGLDSAAKVVEPQSVAPVYAAVMPGSSTAAAEEGNEAAIESELEENIGFLAPAIGSYYFSFAALNKASTYYYQNHLAIYRMVPNAKLPSKAPAPAMTVNLPPNATQAQRMQAQQAIIAAQHAAAAAPAKPVEGYVPTRVISDIFCAQGSGPLAGASLAYLGVDKDEEFSPVFGGGPHLITPEPEVAAGDLLALTTGWVENQGAVVECEEGVEVSPLVSYAGEGLEVLASEGHVFTDPFEVTLQGASDEGRAKHNAGVWAAPLLLAYAVGAGLAVVKQVASK